jgi:hypothetical protein
VHRGKQLLILDRAASSAGQTRTQQVTVAGSAVTVTPAGQVVVRRRGRIVGQVSLPESMADWLKQDHLWGGHKAANDLTYRLRLTNPGGDALSDLTPYGGEAFAIVTWRSGGSGAPALAQYLVRLRLKPTATLEPLRRLTPIAGLYQSTTPRRLFASGKRLLLYVRPDPGLARGRAPADRLEQIDRDGQPLSLRAEAPAGLEPVGLVEGRWIVLRASSGSARTALWLLDTRGRRAAPLPGTWKGLYFASSLIVPDHGDRILVVQTDPKSPLVTTTYAVTVPSGRRVRLPTRPGHKSAWLWQGHAILYDRVNGREVLTICRLDTGKVVQRLPWPN